MRDILPTLARWVANGRGFALGTVIATSASAPRAPGAALAVAADGEVVGSVSGGCVEGAVVETALAVLDGAPARVERYGYSDDTAFAVGLTCGGRIEVFVEKAGPALHAAVEAAARAAALERPLAVATVVEVPTGVRDVRPGARLIVEADAVDGEVGTEGLAHAVTADARGALAQGRDASRRYGAQGERRLDDVAVFVESFAPRPRMLVFGAIDFASAVARAGAFLGYHVTVCDARGVFATAARFPDADEVVVEWPHRYLARTETDERTVVCVLTHDPKFDVPLLEVALRRPAAYVGAMGSRRTHAERLALLREQGLDEDELARLRSPIGLDLGGRTPEETAISVAAEIIALRWDGSGRPLSQEFGTIHVERSTTAAG